MRSLIFGGLVLLAGCGATQPAPPPQPQVQYYLPIDADWFFINPDVQVRRKGAWSEYGDNRHYWARYWDRQGGEYVVAEHIANCTARTTMQLSNVVYNINTHKVLGSYSAPSREMRPIYFTSVTPDTLGEAAFDLVCQAPQVR